MEKKTLLFKEEAKDILANFKPVMTKEEYLAYQQNNDRTITLR